MNHKLIKNPLEETIIKLIKHNSFITLDEFIQLCLFHEPYGYYRQKLPLGSTQDFTTAPEISQLFGEILGFWLIKQWQNLNCPNKLLLVELGPGNGTLMLDLLKLVKQVPPLYQAIDLYLIEINPRLRKKQEQKLTTLAIETNTKVHWFTDLTQLNNNDHQTTPIIIIANEFLDVFPVKQFKYKGSAWHEVVVTLNHSQAIPTNFSLALNKSSTNLSRLLPQKFIPKTGMVFEYAAAAVNYLKIITSLLQARQGAAVIIDYGYIENSYTNTIQAICKHQKINFLTNPGESDITHLVNFPLLQQQLQNLNLKYNISTQREFLTALGIKQRLQVLLKVAKAPQKNAIISGASRILDHRDMGNLFKVLEITTI